MEILNDLSSQLISEVNYSLESAMFKLAYNLTFLLILNHNLFQSFFNDLYFLRYLNTLKYIYATILLSKIKENESFILYLFELTLFMGNEMNEWNDDNKNNDFCLKGK